MHVIASGSIYSTMRVTLYFELTKLTFLTVTDPSVFIYIPRKRHEIRLQKIWSDLEELGVFLHVRPYHFNWTWLSHDDVINWKHSRVRCWPFVRGIHRSPVGSTHKGQWRRDLMFSLICAWTNSWTNDRDTGDLRRSRAHCDVTIMQRHGYEC